MANTVAYCPGPTDRIHVTRTGQKTPSQKNPSPGTASLLAQLGAHATARFARHLAILELVPAHAGIFEILAGTPGMSQCALARILGTLPSRMVGYVDELERKGLLERRPYECDRRNNALYLTKAGQAAYHATARLAQQHQQTLLAGLSKQQQLQFAELLELIANQQGLISGPVSHISKKSGKTLHARYPSERPKEAPPAEGAPS